LGVCFPNVVGRVRPTQLYEAEFLFLLFAVCSYLLLKKGFKHNMSLYLIAYGIFRFLIEYVRHDERGELLGFITPSQFWSVLMVGLGIGLIFIMKRIGKNFVPVTVEETASEEASSDEQ
jgi:phosphatidylglycerol:prolipoprotein diacylglycerol transferase